MVVGHSNTCISPLAAAVLRALGEERGLPLAAQSCGFWAKEGQLPLPAMVTAAGEIGLDLADHRARYATDERLAAAGLLLPQDGMIARGLAPIAKARPGVRLLRPLLSGGLNGTTLTDFRRARGEVLAACERLVKMLKKEQAERQALAADITVGPLAPAMAGEVAALEAACFSHPWTRQNVLDELQKPNGCFVAALLQGALVGYASAAVAGQTGYMNNVAVAANYRGLGIATRLLTELEQRCRAAGAESMTLEVRCANRPARALYEGLGYRPVGVRPGFYRDPPDDAAIYTKPLE